MKKILISILTILGIGLSFCNADGIYHNSELGLISIVSGGNTVYTISDKNNGASVVYNNGDTITESNAGYFYQWGNNHGFPISGSLGRDGTRVDVDGYGPGNYYSGSTWINSNPRFNGDGNNLWGGVTNTKEAMQGPCNDGFYVPTYSDLVGLNSILINGFGLPNNGSTYVTYLKVPYVGYRYGGMAIVQDQGNSFSFYTSNRALLGYATYNYIIQGNSNSISFSQSAGTIDGRSIRCFKNSVVNPDYTWSVLYGDIIQNPAPIFKVNYGNTSYQYELEDNLFIYLKSPTVQSGNTFTYAGSTGINLYFNGSSQFYSKDKLFLNTPSWFSNNVFTPICL